MIELSEQDRRLLDAGQAVDAEGGPYVLIRKDVYARLLEQAAEGPGDAYPAIDRAFAPGWDAPGMEEYDRYEEHRP
jgi:hypothetical protein